jgi:hypothetical protein
MSLPNGVSIMATLWTHLADPYYDMFLCRQG